jgi:hypothetical protein
VCAGRNKFNEDEIGRACSIHRRAEECVQNFGGKARRKETNVGGRIILKWV